MANDLVLKLYHAHFRPAIHCQLCINLLLFRYKLASTPRSGVLVFMSKNWTSIVPAFPLSRPLEYVYVTQGFAENETDFYKQMGLAGHTGQDYRAVNGTPIFAVTDAVCNASGQDYHGGRYVKLMTDPKVVGGVEYKLEFMYYHLQEWSVIAGERVYRGQQVGLTDNTGRYTTGPHLHLEMTVWWKETGLWLKDANNGFRGCVDPEPFFTYVPPMNNPYNIQANTLVQLTEGNGGFALWSGEKFYVDELAKLLASWAVRNKGNTDGKTLAVAQVVWDAYRPHYTLNNKPI